MLRTILIFMCAVGPIWVYGQQEFNEQSILIEEDKPLTDFLSEIEQQSAFRFFYIESWLETYQVSEVLSGKSLQDILQTTLNGSEIGVIFLYDYAVIFLNDPQQELARDAIIESATSTGTKVDMISLGSRGKYTYGNQLNLKGIITNKNSQTPLPGVTVYVHGLNKSTQSDANGQYHLVMPGGEYIVSFRFLNYEERLLNLEFYEDGVVNFELEEVVTTLEEVVISDHSIVERRVGQSSIKMTELNRSPAFLGEVDVIKSLQIKTGVTTVSEASSGFNVRGGGVDQNLVLYDGVPVFNTSHALGFFTAFNSDAIRESSFYKGGIPAEYGGRVSSVLNIASKEGSFQKWGGDFGIGMVSSHLMVGGPLKKDSSSLILSARSTYSDWLLDVLQKKHDGIEESSVFFYDGTIKYAEKLENGDKLTLSLYNSRDRFRLASDTINQWQTFTIAARYDGDFGRDYHYRLGLYVGRYSYQVSEMEENTAFDLSYSIFYPSLKLDFNKGGKHEQSFGFHSTFYNFRPGDLKPTSPQSNSKSITMAEERSMESAIYFSDAFLLGNRLNIELGLRLSMFNRIGPGLVYEYQAHSPLEPKNVVDSVDFDSGEVMKTFIGPEPRISVRYPLGQHASLKLGFNRVYQYVHLISNTATTTPVDIWQSSNTYFEPQIADQISLGYFRSSKTDSWQSFIEVYYKDTKNILDFKEGANLILNPKLETALMQGRGKSFGVEFSLSKTKGRFETEINYTFSRSQRKINGNFESEKINNGNWYSSNYDQPHIINLSWRYSLTRKIFFSGIFTYHTGRPISMPISAYEINGVPIIDFSNRNNYRLPDYHRLDLALVIEGSNKKNRKINGRWTISIYNVYGRKNPYSAFFTYNVAGAVKPNQISLIGVPVPAITYGFKF
ncbi:MAG: TonB-dependent receptor [Cyclobacteriaceae bacterium]